MNFWNKLPKPFFVLAPLADVTDAPFRRLIAKYSAHERSDGTIGGPDVMWTEFVSADGIIRATPEGKEKLMADLIFSEEERPIVAQLFSSNLEYMEKAVRFCKKLGFDGIDINMGCPDRSIEKQGCGSAMIKNPDNACEIIRVAKKGAGDLPITVKTRVGYNKDEIERWLPQILSESPAAVIIHARTRKEMSKVPARWEHVGRAVEIRDEIQNEAWRRNNDNQYPTLIIGNGDVKSVIDARKMAIEVGADGVMLGRAIFGNPWLFHPEKDLSNISIEERLNVMLEHTKLFTKLLPFKNFSVMKKHYKAYVNGFNGAKELRVKLMESNSVEEIEKKVSTFIQEAPNSLLQSSGTLISNE